MSRRQWTFFIVDIIDAIEKIQEYCSGASLDAFQEDERTVDAVERKFILIGEATGHIPSQIVEKYPSVPWREMRDMRNFAVHVYWGVKPEVVWDTIQRDLPNLLAELRVILAQERGGEQTHPR